MFRKYDTVTLTAMNVYDRDGNLIYLTIPFPLKDENIILPESTAVLSITEFHQGQIFHDQHVFNIYVGKVSTVGELVDRNIIPRRSKVYVYPKDRRVIMDPVVYQEKNNNTCEIIATLEEGDIVVENVEELIRVLKQISDEFANIRNSVNKIRTLGRRKSRGGNNE